MFLQLSQTQMWRSSSLSSSARSLSSSTCSPTSTNPTIINDNPFLPKTIQEVWNDISIPSDLHHTSSRRVILQDFFSKEPPPTAVSSSRSQPPPPPTMLTLSSPHDPFGSLLLKPNYQPPLNVPLGALVSDDAAGGGKKRFLDSDRYSGDCRHKRMMKNRVSAARSRARKQELITLQFYSSFCFFFPAYTNELELQVAHLRQQNATLKKQQQQLHMAAAGGEQQKRKKFLHRTSSAPI